VVGRRTLEAAGLRRRGSSSRSRRLDAEILSSYDRRDERSGCAVTARPSGRLALAAHIRLATPERVPRVAAMLGRAFVVEPAVLWSYGAHGDLAARFGRLFEIWEESFVESGMLWEAGDALGRRD
jgi:hypothetical protein